MSEITCHLAARINYCVNLGDNDKILSLAIDKTSLRALGFAENACSETVPVNTKSVMVINNIYSSIKYIKSSTGNNLLISYEPKVAQSIVESIRENIKNTNKIEVDDSYHKFVCPSYLPDDLTNHSLLDVDSLDRCCDNCMLATACLV